MEHINRIELQGRIGTIRTQEFNGRKVANFSMATEYLYKTREGNAAIETTWFNVTAWDGKNMPDFEQIQKGCPVYVAGRMKSSKYTTADGIEKVYMEVIADKVKFIEDEVND